MGIYFRTHSNLTGSFQYLMADLMRSLCLCSLTHSFTVSCVDISCHSQLGQAIRYSIHSVFILLFRINILNMSKYWRRELSVEYAKELHILYNRFIRILGKFRPLLPYLPITPIERFVKGIMFDCTMCGACVLSSTGMSCPMNCPKDIRNGPCGGVRKDGGCEVDENMPCVWVLAARGRKNMGIFSNDILSILNHENRGKSSWLREIQTD